ncbi:Uncharacterised protein [Enterobacter hormaechei]|nr:Uncharacterised protein [Enterobacter hormaechei]VAG12033.1 Uncharacterised protein [Enterobacter hormaechei]
MLTQNLLHHLRHGLVLENAALAGAAEQRQTGAQLHLVMRLVGSGEKPLQTGDDAVHCLPAAHAQGGVLHQYLFGGEIILRGGEVDGPAEGLAERLAALKTQHVGRDAGVRNVQGVTGLSVEERQPVIHNKDLI